VRRAGRCESRRRYGSTGRGLLRSSLIVGVTALAAAVVSPVASTTVTTSPCTLVTAADARASLGASVEKSKLPEAGLYQSCRYSTKTSKDLVVLARPLGKSDFTKSAKANPGPIVAVPGIGDAAYSVGGGGTTLLVWKNGTELVISIHGVGAALHAEEQLARKVIGRL
jgi:hypothetical protein